MQVKIIEASQNPTGGMVNWGKFLLARYTDEWHRRSGLYEAARRATDEVAGEGTYDEVNASHPDPEVNTPLLRRLGWAAEHLWVMDMQTGEGAMFRPGGSAHADLDKHRIWVCPLFEPFLEFLYAQGWNGMTDLSTLPDVVTLPDAEFDFRGYRRPGDIR